MYTPKTNPKQKHMETTQRYEKGALLLNNSPRGRLTRSGELKASKHCSLLHNRSPWRVGWRANTALCHVVARRGEQTTRSGEL